MREHVRILVDLGRIAGEAILLGDFLEQAVVQVARAVEISHAKILRYRVETGDFIVEAGVGWQPGVVRTATLSADLRSAPGRAFRTGEPVIVRDFQSQNEYVISAFLKHHGIVSLANAPMLIGASTWGVLPDARRAGVGSQLLEAAQEWAGERGYETFRLECPNGQRPMLHMAIGMGYDIVGTRADADRGVTMVLFEKHLG